MVSPTYVPDLANAALDLLIDRERGVWHLANGGAVSWLEFVRRGAALAGVDTTRLREEEEPVARPYRVLGSQRGMLLPPLDDALPRYIAEAAVSCRPRVPRIPVLLGPLRAPESARQGLPAPAAALRHPTMRMMGSAFLRS